MLCNPGTPALIKRRSSLHEPAASSSRSNLCGYGLVWAKPNRGLFILTCANALSGSR